MTVSEFPPNLRSMTEWESIMSAVALGLTAEAHANEVERPRTGSSPDV